MSLWLTENPAAYVSGHLERGMQESEEEPERSPLVTTLFRTRVIKAKASKNQIWNIVGLT